MKRSELILQIQSKKNFLCVGLDPDLSRLPKHLPRDVHGIEEFCREIINATNEFCISYKLNTAFFEALGGHGILALERLVEYIPPTHFIIADAKRGDIGNTSKQYAKAFFETIGVDALTVAPYMGEDSIRPFMEYDGKWAIILGLTSNEGSHDFELLKINEEYLYERVLTSCAQWGTIENTMFVIGATQDMHMKNIRQMLPNHFFLVPGIGAQGGSLESVCRSMMNQDVGLLVNSSREIIFANDSKDYMKYAADKAMATSKEMSLYIT